MASNSFLDIKAINRNCVITVWISILIASIPRYFDTHSYYEMFMVLAIGWGSFIIPTVIWFFKKDSIIFRYLLCLSSYTALFSILYQQDGAIGAIFLLCVLVAFTAIFFDNKLTIFSTVSVIIILVTLFHVNHDAFFPLLNSADFAELCTGLFLVGLFMVLQAGTGNRLIGNAETVNENLRTILVNIADTSEILDQSIDASNHNIASTKAEIDQISLSVKDASSALTEQTVNAADVRTALDAIKTNISNMSDSVNEMSGSASQTFQLADDGKSMIHSLARQINRIDGATAKTTQLVSMLNNQSNQINEIAEFITGISGQVNLLALNANIEASRAGDAGKGFAVVADEIKMLAGQTSKLAKDISSILGKTINHITDVTKEIDEGQKAVERGIAITEDTKKHFEDILLRINAINDRSQSISTDTQNLSNESTNILHKIRNIESAITNTSDVSKEIAQSTHVQSGKLLEIETAMTQLNSLSRQLKALLKHSFE